MKKFATILAMSLCVTLAAAQSLGDVARQQREKKSGDAAEKLKPLVNDLRSPDLKTRTKAAMYVWQASPRMGTDTIEPVLPALTEAVLDVDLNIRYMAISSLKNFGRASTPAVPALIKALDTFPGGKPPLQGPPRYYVDVRWVAAEALGAVGPGAKDAVPALSKALNDVSPNVREAAEAALKRIQVE